MNLQGRKGEGKREDWSKEEDKVGEGERRGSRGTRRAGKGTRREREERVKGNKKGREGNKEGERRGSRGTRRAGKGTRSGREERVKGNKEKEKAERQLRGTRKKLGICLCFLLSLTHLHFPSSLPTYRSTSIILNSGGGTFSLSPSFCLTRIGCLKPCCSINSGVRSEP